MSCKIYQINIFLHQYLHTILYYYEMAHCVLDYDYYLNNSLQNNNLCSFISMILYPHNPILCYNLSKCPFSYTNYIIYVTNLLLWTRLDSRSSSRNNEILIYWYYWYQILSAWLFCIPCFYSILCGVLSEGYSYQNAWASIYSISHLACQ